MTGNIDLATIIVLISNFAQPLVKLCLQEGDVVHIVLPSCIEFHVTVFAIWFLGGIASLTDPSLRISTLLEQIKDIQASFVICQSDHELNLPGKTYKVIKMENIFGNTSLENVHSRPDFSIARRLMDKTLAIFWSSGTAGITLFYF